MSGQARMQARRLGAALECRGVQAGLYRRPPQGKFSAQKRAFRLMIVKMIAQMPQMMPIAAAGTTISTCVVSCRHCVVQTGTCSGTPAGTPGRQAHCTQAAMPARRAQAERQQEHAPIGVCLRC